MSVSIGTYPGAHVAQPSVLHSSQLSSVHSENNNKMSGVMYKKMVYCRNERGRSRRCPPPHLETKKITCFYIEGAFFAHIVVLFVEAFFGYVGAFLLLLNHFLHVRFFLVHMGGLFRDCPHYKNFAGAHLQHICSIFSFHIHYIGHYHWIDFHIYSIRHYH